MTILYNLNAKLKQPYPSRFSWKEAWSRALVFGAFVVLFLGYFKPFGMASLVSFDLWKVASTFGIITLGSILLTIGSIPKIFKEFHREESWTLGKEIFFTCYNFVLIGTLNFCYFAYLNELPSKIWITAFAGLQLGTLAVGAAPTILFILYDQNRLLRKNLLTAQEISNHIINEPADKKNLATEKKPLQLAFKAENGNTELSISINQFLFLQSAGNYLDIHYLNDGQEKKAVLRNRLKSIATTLDTDIIYQCHRSYLVNLQQVTTVSGNARGLILHLENCSTPIPVSRGKTQEIETLLEKK